MKLKDAKVGSIIRPTTRPDLWYMVVDIADTTRRFINEAELGNYVPLLRLDQNRIIFGEPECEIIYL